MGVGERFESGAGERREAMKKEERKVVVKCIEKEYVYTQNLVEILAKKYNVCHFKNEINFQK